jgi:hypothetical protein
MTTQRDRVAHLYRRLEPSAERLFGRQPFGEMPSSGFGSIALDPLDRIAHAVEVLASQQLPPCPVCAAVQEDAPLGDFVRHEGVLPNGDTVVFRDAGRGRFVIEVFRALEGDGTEKTSAPVEKAQSSP